jgi:glycosyltransferase involved in cell wall biosynthesis
VFSPLPETPTLLFFGRLSYYKGLDTLLDAMPAVWERVPEARLVVAGQGDLPEHDVYSDPRIVLRHEHVADEEVEGLFESATSVVLPYRQASQSGVGSLAKRYGRALVSTTVGGLPELVSPDVGTLVAPEDPTALAEAISDIVGDPSRAERMGRAAAASGQSDASWGRVAELTLAAYAQHLG